MENSVDELKQISNSYPSVSLLIEDILNDKIFSKGEL